MVLMRDYECGGGILLLLSEEHENRFFKLFLDNLEREYNLALLAVVCERKY